MRQKAVCEWVFYVGLNSYCLHSRSQLCEGIEVPPQSILWATTLLMHNLLGQREKLKLLGWKHVST